MGKGAAGPGDAVVADPRREPPEWCACAPTGFEKPVDPRATQPPEDVAVGSGGRHAGVRRCADRHLRLPARTDHRFPNSAIRQPPHGSRPSGDRSIVGRLPPNTTRLPPGAGASLRKCARLAPSRAIQPDATRPNAIHFGATRPGTTRATATRPGATHPNPRSPPDGAASGAVPARRGGARAADGLRCRFGRTARPGSHAANRRAAAPDQPRARSPHNPGRHADSLPACRCAGRNRPLVRDGPGRPGGPRLPTPRGPDRAVVRCLPGR